MTPENEAITHRIGRGVVSDEYASRPVPFHEDTVVLVGRDNEPYVAMRPVVENIGLAWQVQHRKLAKRFSSTITEMVTTGADGKQYAMSCLPLRKLPAWLYSINPDKVAPGLREKVVRYQEECDEVLWQHWTKGQHQLIAMLEERVTRILPLPGIKRTARDGINFKQLMVLQEQARNLAKWLDATTGPFERQGLHNQLRQVNDALGLPTPPLAPNPLAIQQPCPPLSLPTIKAIAEAEIVQQFPA
jgi:hypothetical protein